MAPDYSQTSGLRACSTCRESSNLKSLGRGGKAQGTHPLEPRFPHRCCERGAAEEAHSMIRVGGTLRGELYRLPHFIDEQTEAQRG